MKKVVVCLSPVSKSWRTLYPFLETAVRHFFEFFTQTHKPLAKEFWLAKHSRAGQSKSNFFCAHSFFPSGQLSYPLQQNKMAASVIQDPLSFFVLVSRMICAVKFCWNDGGSRKKFKSCCASSWNTSENCVVLSSYKRLGGMIRMSTWMMNNGRLQL